MSRRGLTASLAALALAATAGCGSGRRQGEIALEVQAAKDALGTATFYVRCARAPVDSSQRHPLWPQARAFAALEAHPSVLLDAKRFVCRGGPYAWWDLIDYLGISVSQLRSQANSATTLEIAVSIPDGTPRWLIQRARWMARSLHDPHPGKLWIRLGRVDTIDMWGRFVCGKTCSYPDGARPPHGDHASATIDPRDRSVISFALS